MNISVRYHEGKDKRGEPYHIPPLDEVQDNTNQWMKQILLGPDKDSWKQHSLNVSSSNICIHFEEVEFVKIQFDYGEGAKYNDKHHSYKTVFPEIIG